MIRSQNVLAAVACVAVVLLSWATLAVQPRAKVTIETEKSTFRPGEPINLTVTWKNTYYKTVVYGWDTGSNIDLHYPPTIKWNGNKVVTSSWLNRGVGGSVVIKKKPGSERKDKFILNRDYDMTKEGFYTVQVGWYDDEANSETSSNTITINVKK